MYNKSIVTLYIFFANKTQLTQFIIILKNYKKMATPKNTAAEEAAKKAAVEAAAAATTTEAAPAAATPVAAVATTTPATPAPEQPAKAPFYKRPGFWLGVTAVTAIAAAFGAGYKKGVKAGREAANAEIEDDKIASAIGAGIVSANDHNSDRGNSNSGNRVDNNRRG